MRCSSSFMAPMGKPPSTFFRLGEMFGAPSACAGSAVKVSQRAPAGIKALFILKVMGATVG
jgi:hypothetical protein